LTINPIGLREAYPEKKYFLNGPGEFQYGGLRFHFDESAHVTGFGEKYANRGDSAILDYLVPVD
jgi:hypothetical protein